MSFLRNSFYFSFNHRTHVLSYMISSLRDFVVSNKLFLTLSWQPDLNKHTHLIKLAVPAVGRAYYCRSCKTLGEKTEQQ